LGGFFVPVPVLRQNVEKTPAFQRFLARSQPPKAAVREVLAEQRPAVLKVLLLALGQNAGYWVGLIFMNLYLTTHLGYPKTQVYWIMAGVSLCAALMMPFWGGLSDGLGRRRVLTLGFTAYVMLVVPKMLHMAKATPGSRRWRCWWPRYRCPSCSRWAIPPMPSSFPPGCAPTAWRLPEFSINTSSQIW